MTRHIELIKTIGNELRGVREDRRVQVQEVARDVGVSSTYISDIERNIKVPSGELIEKLSEVYGIPRCRLYRGFYVVTNPMIVQLCGSNGLYDILFYLSENDNVSQEAKEAFYIEVERLYIDTFDGEVGGNATL